MEKHEKRKQIQQILSEPVINVSQLWRLGITEYGFIDLQLWKEVWPVLLNVTECKKFEDVKS